MLTVIPPPALVLMAIGAIQLGAVLATHLFPVIGAKGTVAVRILFSALLFLAFSRGRYSRMAHGFINNWLLLLGFGLCVVAMNLFFYQALDRIPLGATVAFEFIGPLSVAAFNSRRRIHLYWVAIAALSIVLLSPLTGADLDPVGITFALLAGFSWGVFIMLAVRVGQHLDGNDGLIIGMTIASLVLIPVFMPIAGQLLSSPTLVLAGIALAVLSTALPFLFEFEALKRMTPRAYGILVSLEPGAAAVIGALLLGERLGLQGMLGVGAVMVAAFGITLSDRTASQ